MFESRLGRTTEIPLYITFLFICLISILFKRDTHRDISAVTWFKSACLETKFYSYNHWSKRFESTQLCVGKCAGIIVNVMNSNWVEAIRLPLPHKSISRSNPITEEFISIEYNNFEFRIGIQKLCIWQFLQARSVAKCRLCFESWSTW